MSVCESRRPLLCVQSRSFRSGMWVIWIPVPVSLPSTDIRDSAEGGRVRVKRLMAAIAHLVYVVRPGVHTT